MNVSILLGLGLFITCYLSFFFSFLYREGGSKAVSKAAGIIIVLCIVFVTGAMLFKELCV